MLTLIAYLDAACVGEVSDANQATDTTTMINAGAIAVGTHHSFPISPYMSMHFEMSVLAHMCVHEDRARQTLVGKCIGLWSITHHQAVNRAGRFADVAMAEGNAIFGGWNGCPSSTYPAAAANAVAVLATATAACSAAHQSKTASQWFEAHRAAQAATDALYAAAMVAVSGVAVHGASVLLTLNLSRADL